MTKDSAVPGLFLVVTGTSGAGKTTAIEGLIKEMERTKEYSAIRLVTVTTRSPGPDERDGVDYHFVTDEEFLKRLKNNEFLEYEACYSEPTSNGDDGRKRHLYASPIGDLMRHRLTYDVTIVSLDPKGAVTAKRIFEDTVPVVMFDASDEVLRARLMHRTRSTNIEARMAGAVEDRHIAATIKDLYVINTDSGTPSQSMHRLLEIVRHWHDLTLNRNRE